jgi:hypothetical protein
MPTRYNKFVHEENVRRFEKLIETETDPSKLTLLQQLLAEEWKQLQHPPNRPHDEGEDGA